MRCEEVIRLLDAFRTCELEQERSRNIALHLRDCSSCTGELSYIEELARASRALRAPAPEAVIKQVLTRTGDQYGKVETQVGAAWVAFNARGITMIHVGKADPEGFKNVFRQRRHRVPRASKVPENYARMVRHAAAGQLREAAPVDISDLPLFERRVLKVLQTIPRGEVRPYGWLARQAGRPRAARAVGNAMARNPIPLLLPCHRVVPSTGGVGNYAFGPPMKRELLRREGVPVDELDDLARARVRYIGCKSTRIYCFPSCHDARRIGRANRVPFETAPEAAAAGYRPCRHCRPG
jgi:O-6-methylguanine DNA methyltransferase